MFTSSKRYFAVVTSCSLLQACSMGRDETRTTSLEPFPPVQVSAAPEAPEVIPPSQVDSLRPTEPEPPFPRWCERAGIAIGDRLIVANSIMDAYLDSQEAACETVALGAKLTDDEFELWIEYLIDYTYLLFWCPMPYEVEGGISAFGPANIAVTGASRGPLGRDDAERLIAMYVDAFAQHLMLSDSERAQLAAHLWSTAEAEIDPTLSSTLALCP
jgi:hypothetical protein